MPHTHTPGPWAIAGNTIGRAIDNTVDVVCTLPDISLDRGQANAHLIAAAPDLLAVLKYARKVLWETLEGDDSAACTQIEWPSDVFATIDATIHIATQGGTR